jgi:hypothetical protein
MHLLNEESLRWVAGGLPASGSYDGEIAVEFGYLYSWNETNHQWDTVADSPTEVADYYDVDLMNSGTSIDGLTGDILSTFDELAAAWGMFGYNPMITHGTDGTHNPGSLHGSGNALDLRTTAMGMSNTQADSVVSYLQSQLGSSYDIINEGDHIHLEYDP